MLIFSLKKLKGKRLYEFRRGVARCAVISSLSFSSDAMFLAVSSNTQTIHVFKLGLEHTQVYYSYQGLGSTLSLGTSKRRRQQGLG